MFRPANIIRSKFVRSVAVVATGTMAAQAIGMVLAPFVTRLYGPEAFGQLGVFNSVVNLLASAAALTYPIAIVLPKSNSDARQIVKISLLAAAAFAILLGAALWILKETVVSVLQLESIAPFMFLIPFMVLLAGVQQTAQQWLIRTQRFAAIAKITVVQALVLNSAYVGAGLLHPVGAVLIGAASTGKFLHAAMFAWVARRGSAVFTLGYDKNSGSRQCGSLAKLAHAYRDFPLFRAPEVLVYSASESLPILFLVAFFDPATAGLFILCRTVLSVPSTLIGVSVGDVLYPRIAEAANRGESLTRLILNATLALAAVGALPYILVVAFGPALFGLVFGSEWAAAGEFARWIAIWQFFVLLNRPSIRAVPVLSVQRLHLLYTCLTLLMLLSTLFIGYRIFDSALMVIALLSASGVAVNVLLIALLIYISAKHNPRRNSDML